MKRLSFVLVLACGPSGSGSTTGSSSPSTMAPSAVTAETRGTEPQQAQSQHTPEDEPQAHQTQAPNSPDLSSWAELLAVYVSDDGFRYAALFTDDAARAKLNAAAEAIAGAQQLEEWPRDERLAFLLNAYNVLTVRAVIERWPIEGVMQIEGFFDGIEHSVAGESMTLNTLENERIRAAFGEPRIHFSVNCASASCPPLRNEPFDAASLEVALEEQARAFVHSSTDIRGRRATVSKLFEWFADDFAADGGVREFIASRLDEQDAAAMRDERTRLRYSNYDWSPNAAE